MASASYSEDLTCPICLTIFTDPVTLLCGHSFCRGCITDALWSQELCPQCRTAVPTEIKFLLTSYILKSLAEKAKEAEKIKTEPAKEKAERSDEVQLATDIRGGEAWRANTSELQVSELCPEHEEKLKLFCVTDQQLACIICRDGERHEGHKLKPIKEAAASVRRELEAGMENLCGDILAIESLANTQRQEIRKTKAKSEQLMTQIHRQFEEMHQFLRKREDEIKNELKFKEQDDVEKMSKSLKVIETALSERRELEAKVTSVVKIEDSERLLKSWTEGNSRVTAEDLIKPKANDLQVVDSSLSLGPYESHLQFFMWKEMLQVIEPRAELLSLKSNSADIAVSEDGRSLFSTPKSNQAPSRSSSGFRTRSRPARASGFGSSGFAEQYEDLPFMSALFTNHAFSVNKFTSGQHYWEVEVGHRDYWELGIKDNFLKYDGQKYSICSPNKTTELGFRDRRRKIGVYLNCALEKLSFYDADNMKHIHTVSTSLMSTPLSAYFHIEVTSPDLNPLMVCWY
ncbi:tripartite motif containing 108 isoform X1 [Epinephelus fuscoguttatus]|uniref:tripartite motif containing 108 isoform X1 n=1 Tax=Epinephelus fuscoguttatus TaxID=293821 RepID=UPI0020D19B32|nr:tripartite motif containing 108 isoform X1 [Epinephelus fuscoguttatus]